VSRGDYWPGERSDLSGDDDDAEEREAAAYEDDEETGDEEPAALAAPAAQVVPEEDRADVEELVGDDGPELGLAGHAPGELDIPDGVEALEGEPRGTRRGVGVVAARFNGDVSSRLLESALAELDRLGIDRDLVTVMAVPGAFELPLGAMALAKTRRFAAIVALGCVIRGETAHFDYVAGEAASGLQLASLETGVPVAFGVLTTDTLEQALARVDKGAEAVRTALEMADVFTQLRATAQTAR
jgi:6,7-dimethyl-8-ribityllumazine synthase